MLHRVTKEEEGKTVVSLVRGALKVSATAFSKMKFSGGVLLNGQPVRARYVVKEGDRIELIFPQQSNSMPAPSSCPLDVVFEDDDLLIVNKPAPLLSIGSQSGVETLENRVYSYIRQPENFVYRPVNRLDKGTSGLMALAKDGHTHQLMQKMLHTGEFVREYLAVVEGIPSKEGCIDRPIGRVGPIRHAVIENGKPANTRYWLIQSAGQRSLVRLRLFTGRTHQIRVHLASIGHPVVGDFLYGKEDERLPGRFALHAHRLQIKHPMTGKTLDLSAPLPKELEELISFPH